MADRLSPEERSENMRKIRGRDTKPELVVRRFLHGRGLRYRLHRRDLPGCPDLVFPRHQACVFIHGCFWHGCRKCVDGLRVVQSRTEYWQNKVKGNAERDRRNVAKLRGLGWRVITIWECQITKPFALLKLELSIRSA